MVEMLAIFAFSEKALFIISWFIILVRCWSITSAASFTSLGGIPSGPVAFLGFKDLIILLISSLFAKGIEKGSKLSGRFSFILIMQGWSLYFIMISYTVFTSTEGVEGSPKYTGALSVVFSTM